MAPTCRRCGKAVYFAEEKIALGKKWHKNCVRCKNCNAPLSSNNMTDHDDELYCRSCHGKLFGTKGYGYGGGSAGVLAGTGETNGDSSKPAKTWNASSGATSPVMSKLGGGGTKCKKCGQTVYFAEEVVALGKKWHKRCLKCSECKTSLSSTNMTDHNDELYCRNCHGKLFGTKGYGYGGGSAGVLAGTHEVNGDSPKQSKKTWNSKGVTSPVASKLGGGGAKCPKCEKTVYFAEEMNALGKKWHKWCLKCTKCEKTLDSTTMTDHDEELYCKNCHGKLFGTKGYGYGGGSAGILSATHEANGTNGDSAKQSKKTWNSKGVTSPVASKLGGGGAKCPKCEKTVYFAEEMNALGKKWHKWCLKCTKCAKTLDSTTMTDHDEELYCKNCHGQLFGTKGYGFGGGSAGILSATFEETDGTNGITSPTKTWNATGTTSSVALKLGGGGDKCGHCGQTVYFAERLIGGEGKVFHKACFTCCNCKKQLDSTTVVDHDRELFCKACYGKHFGPKGYGYGAGAGTLTITE